MKKGLIILSGGMDSTTLLYQKKDDIALAVSFNYGSKHNYKEINYAAYHCYELGIEHIKIDLPFINDIFKSDLLKSGNDIPEGHYEDESMKRTVVPFRNGIMLSIAAGIAESRGLTNIYLGNHAGDHAIYPDCRPGFILAIGKAINLGTYTSILIIAPYTHLDKIGIGIIGRSLGIDYSKTWTCYKGEDIHCGVCGSCTERKEALEGFDNTKYKQ